MLSLLPQETNYRYGVQWRAKDRHWRRRGKTKHMHFEEAEWNITSFKDEQCWAKLLTFRSPIIRHDPSAQHSANGSRVHTNWACGHKEEKYQGKCVHAHVLVHSSYIPIYYTKNLHVLFTEGRYLGWQEALKVTGTGRRDLEIIMFQG